MFFGEREQESLSFNKQSHFLEAFHRHVYSIICMAVLSQGIKIVMGAFLLFDETNHLVEVFTTDHKFSGIESSIEHDHSYVLIVI